MSDNVKRDEPGRRKVERMVDRTAAWTRELLKFVDEPAYSSTLNPVRVLAPVLPLDVATQSQYLAQLEADIGNGLFGLALYDSTCKADLPSGLQSAISLSLDDPDTPHKVLNEVDLGIDLVALPFIGTASDAGLALNFVFPVPDHFAGRTSDRPTQLRPLAIDMWAKDHATDISPFREGCSCYACKTHHRAYIHHLFNAKEMLAWVLLQIHNHHIIDAFFAGIRESISQGSFASEVEVFSKVYEPKLPEKTGQGPR